MADHGAESAPGPEVTEHALRAIVSNLTQPVVHLDLHGKVRWANDAARIIHLSLEDGQRQEPMPLDRLQAALRLIDVAADHGGAGRARIGIVTDAALFERDAVAHALADGSLLLAFEAPPAPNAAPNEAEARLHAMLEHTHDIITVLAADGTIRYSNPAAGELTGLRGIDANGANAFDFVHPDDAEAAAAALTTVLDGGTVDPIEVRLRFADGAWHPAEVFLENLLDNPAVEGLVVTIRDLSDKHMHEEAARQSEQRLRSLVENLSDVIVVLGPDLNVVYASPGIEAFVPAPAYTNLGENAFNDMHPDDIGRVQDEIASLMARPGSSTRLELRLGNEDDGWRWVEVTAVNRLDDPSVHGLVCTLRDVSDRRAAGDELRRAYERERQAAMKLRELDRLKDEFLATVSHELRTPLTSISGFTQVLTRSENLDDQERSLLERVSRSAREMTSMIENLLDFSRLQAGRVAINLQPLELRDVVDEVVDALSHQLSEHELHVTVPDCRVTADPAGVGHILRNLLVNAAKYSEPGTRISVSASLSDTEAIVAVTDQGIGIPVQLQTAIFQHFYQADPGRTGRRGAGVGLNIARRYAQLQGGRLWLESAPGRGSTFYASLPLVTA